MHDTRADADSKSLLKFLEPIKIQKLSKAPLPNNSQHKSFLDYKHSGIPEQKLF